METIGLLSGIGRLPVDVALSAKSMGYRVIAVGVVPDIDPELAEAVDAYYDITKELLYKAGAVVPDLRAIKILASVPDRKDDTIMNAIVKELEGEGIKVMDQTLLIQPLLPPPGVLTQRMPTEAEVADMDFGFTMAKEIGRLDIGQTVVVKDRALMAVEAIEGTDACILRGGTLGKGVIVAKTAKPAQDNRFDMPSIGTKTMESMIAAGATGLVIEAGRTLLVEKEKTLALADAHNITIVAR